jgi:hypothetical protein
VSRNSGRTWTMPVKINKTPNNRTNPFREAAFLPTIAVTDTGILAVTYYDFRNDGSDGELTDQFALFCNPATSNCARANRWGQEKRLTDLSFDMLDAPDAGGHFLGDYMGSESVTSDVHPVYGIADGTDQTSLFTRKLSVGAAVAAK